MTLDAYLAMNHVPIYCSIVIDSTTACILVQRSFDPIPAGGPDNHFAVGSGPEPVAILQLPAHGGYIRTIPATDCPGLMLRADPEIPGDSDFGPLVAAEAMRHAMRRQYGLTCTVIAPPHPVNTGHSDDDWHSQ